jgi:hypothetical protein
MCRVPSYRFDATCSPDWTWSSCRCSLYRSPGDPAQPLGNVWLRLRRSEPSSGTYRPLQSAPRRAALTSSRRERRLARVPAPEARAKRALRTFAQCGEGHPLKSRRRIRRLCRAEPTLRAHHCFGRLRAGSLWTAGAAVGSAAQRPPGPFPRAQVASRPSPMRFDGRMIRYVVGSPGISFPMGVDLTLIRVTTRS